MFSSVTEIRGFNYSGSWGTSGLDLWQHHDNGAMAVEVARGKKYFPGWNAVRWWLSHEAFGRDQRRFTANFDAGLAIFAKHDIQVMPVLFNRWRNHQCEFGGVAIDHILPEFGKEAAIDPEIGRKWGVQKVFGDYLENVVGGHSDDPRIFAWDICNEPLHRYYAMDLDNPITQAELGWLSWCRDTCKAAGATQPLTIGCYDKTTTELTEPLVDLISFHPYYIPSAAPLDTPLTTTKDDFERSLDDVAALAARRGKEALASESVWEPSTMPNASPSCATPWTRSCAGISGSWPMPSITASWPICMHPNTDRSDSPAEWNSSTPTDQSAPDTKPSTSSADPPYPIRW